MVGENTRLTRGDVAVIVTIAIGLLVSFVALVQWELSRECVRWSTRIDIDSLGNVSRTKVCAEFRPRQYGEEPPFDPSSPKGEQRGR
jgi:hypothetical protein